MTTGPPGTRCCTSSLYQRQLTPSQLSALPGKDQYLDEGQSAVTEPLPQEIKMPGNSSIHRAKKQDLLAFPQSAKLPLVGGQRESLILSARVIVFLDNV